MKVAILGTNGFLSNSMAQYCCQHNFETEMYGIEKPNGTKYTRYYNIDIFKDTLNYSNLIDNDIIIYAIGAGIQSNLKESFKLIYDLNLNVPITICENLKKLEYKGLFVTFGSYFEIGENKVSKKFTEDMLLFSLGMVPNSYSISKRLLSRYISSFKGPFKNYHFILPTIYGEKESPHRLIPYTIYNLKNNLSPSFTSGNQVRQYIYIDDLPQIIFKSFETNLESGIYNVEGTETLTVKDVVLTLYSKFDLKLSEEAFSKVDRVDTGMLDLQLDGRKLYSQINFCPTIKITDVYDRY